MARLPYQPYLPDEDEDEYPVSSGASGIDAYLSQLGAPEGVEDPAGEQAQRLAIGLQELSEPPQNVQLVNQALRSPGPYGAGSPPPVESLADDNDRFYMGTPNYSSERMTPGELGQMDAGFQALADPGYAEGTDAAEAPWPLASDSPEVKAQKYDDRREYVQDGPRPLPLADARAQQIFGQAYGQIGPREQRIVVPGGDTKMSRREAFERAGGARPAPGMTAAEARANRDKRSQETHAWNLANPTKSRRRGQGRSGPGPARRPMGTEGGPEGSGEVQARLSGALKEQLGVDELDPAWSTRVGAISRLTSSKERAKAEIALSKDIQKWQRDEARGGVAASPAKRAQQIEDFNMANEHTGLSVRIPGRYGDVINKRGSAAVEREIGTVNRAMHASARMQRLDRMYSAIPFVQRGSQKAIRIAKEFDFLRDEHQGIILKISGMGVGDKESRQEIKRELPKIRTTLRWWSEPQLEGLHNMLMKNGQGILQGYGLQMTRPDELGDINYTKGVGEDDYSRKHWGGVRGEAVESDDAEPAAKKAGQFRTDQIEW